MTWFLDDFLDLAVRLRRRRRRLFGLNGAKNCSLRAIGEKLGRSFLL
jgi:hypothetical protein